LLQHIVLMKKIKLFLKKIHLKWNIDVHKTLVLNAKILLNENNKLKSINSLEDVEFKVFSQNGEDGIIQYIINKLEIPNKIFIEFGVETYIESNTRFLLINNEWSGLILESDTDYVNFIKNDYVFQKYELEIEKVFITKDNINSIFKNYTNLKDIGLLSIDIDGNDYWIWKTITEIQPRIVICEYNATFGNSKKVTIPYKADFNKNTAHYSDLFFGASLNALCDLADKKGYDFIGTCSSGANAFFIRKDINTSFKPLKSIEGFNKLSAKSSKDKNGNLTYLRPNERLSKIKDEKIFDLESNNIVSIKELYNL
jgi:hypothetical protein